MTCRVGGGKERSWAGGRVEEDLIKGMKDQGMCLLFSKIQTKFSYQILMKLDVMHFLNQSNHL